MTLYCSGGRSNLLGLPKAGTPTLAIGRHVLCLLCLRGIALILRGYTKSGSVSQIIVATFRLARSQGSEINCTL